MLASLAFAAAALVQVGVSAPLPALQPGETLLEVAAQGQASGVPDVAEFTTGVTARIETADRWSSGRREVHVTVPNDFALTR